MKQSLLTLLRRSARIDYVIASIQARHNAKPVHLLRLKALRLAIRERVRRLERELTFQHGVAQVATPYATRYTNGRRPSSAT